MKMLQEKKDEGNPVKPNQKLITYKINFYSGCGAISARQRILQYALYAALIGNMEIFLLICILPLNLLSAFLYLAQSKVNMKLN